MSSYWAAGGMAGIDTLGGTIEEQARAPEPGLIRLTWAAVGLRVAGAALALARPWAGACPGGSCWPQVGVARRC